MTFPDAVPQRLSDAEREAAVAQLQLHADAGRLSPDEFDERTAQARAARTASDMALLFGDLPAPHPYYLDAAQPTWNTYPGSSGASPGVRPPEPGSPSAQGYASGPAYPGAQGYPPGPSYPGAQGFPPGPVYTGTVVVPPQAPPPPTQRERWAGVAQAIIWPVAILLMVTGHGGFPVLLLAIILSSALGGYQGNRRYRRRRPPY